MGEFVFQLLCVVIAVSPAASRIVYSEKASFSEFPDVEIDNNTLSFISPRISGFILQKNAIKKIGPEAFVSFRSLQSLEIEENKLEDLQPGAFDGLDQLKELFIVKEQKLTTLKRNLFTELKNLNILKLHNNGLTNLEHGTLDGVKKLHYLDLSQNKLTRIESGIFNELGELVYLNLYQNQLQCLEPGVFRGLRKLDFLNLEKNNLNSLRLKTFNGLKRLTFLNLAENHLTNLEPELFYRFGYDDDDESLRTRKVNRPIEKNLKYLQLQSNKIICIQRNTFRGLNLTLLNLQRNQINEIEFGAFSGLAVKELSLNLNALTVIKIGAFDGIVYVRKLDLSGNPIIVIEDDAFKRVQPMQVLFISFTEDEIFANRTIWGVPSSSEVQTWTYDY